MKLCSSCSGRDPRSSGRDNGVFIKLLIVSTFAKTPHTFCPDHLLTDALRMCIHMTIWLPKSIAT